MAFAKRHKCEFKHIHPHKIYGIFHKLHPQQEAASFKCPEDHVKQKILSDSNFISTYIVIFSAKAVFESTAMSLKLKVKLKVLCQLLFGDCERSASL